MPRQLVDIILGTKNDILRIIYLARKGNEFQWSKTEKTN